MALLADVPAPLVAGTFRVPSTETSMIDMSGVLEHHQPGGVLSTVLIVSGYALKIGAKR